METKVLATIMKLQAAQVMLSTYGISTYFTTLCIKHGNLELTAFTHNDTEDKIASEILEAYESEEIKKTYRKHNEGTDEEFRAFTLKVYMTNLTD